MTPIAKLFDYRHAVLGDAMANIAIADQLTNRGYSVCGGDIKELEASAHIDPQVIIIGGGGLIFEEDVKNFSGGPVYSRGLLNLARNNKKLYFTGTGFNTFWLLNSKTGEKEVATCPQDFLKKGIKSKQLLLDWLEILDSAQIVSLRDQGSLDACHKTLGVHLDKKFHHAPCPSFLLLDDIDLDIEINKKLVVWSVSPKNEFISLEKQKLLLLYLYKEMKMDILFMPHSLEDYENYKTEGLVDLIKGKIINVKDKPIAALQILQQASLHISTRLHGMIASVITATPLLHFSEKSTKTGWQASQIGLDEYKYLYKNKETSLSDLKEALKDIKDNKQIRIDFRKIAREAQNRTIEHFHHIPDLTKKTKEQEYL